LGWGFFSKIYSPVLRMSVRPASSMMEDENGLGIQKLVPQTSVYTLG